jgi:site-specific DNA-methyltransferase (adenine-specific)
MKLYHDDCFNVFPTLEDKSIDLVLCDMPYGTTACKWDTVIDLERMWFELKRLVSPDTAIVLFSQMPFSAVLVASNLKQFKYNWVWDKSQGTGHLNAKKAPLKNHEDIQVFYHKQPTYNPQFTKGTPYKTISGISTSDNYNEQTRAVTNNEGVRYPKTIIQFLKERRCAHPTQKPVALMEYLIKTYSNEGNVVLDFCMGSGTTGVACKNLKRSFIGIEKEENYFNIAKERIENA